MNRFKNMNMLWLSILLCWLISKLQRIMEELLQTEREYVRALGYVMEHYLPELERQDVPQDLRGQRGSIFGNLEKLREFHQHHFLEELELCLRHPFRVGRCFLRHVSKFLCIWPAQIMKKILSALTVFSPKPPLFYLCLSLTVNHIFPKCRKKVLVSMLCTAKINLAQTICWSTMEKSSLR